MKSARTLTRCPPSLRPGAGLNSNSAQLPDGLVVTHDVLAEDVHFRLDWISWQDLGYRAAAVNLSDLAASAAGPEALLVSLALPRTTPVEDVLELYAGLNEPGVAIVGGDLAAGELLHGAQVRRRPAQRRRLDHAELAQRSRRPHQGPDR